jgi:sec-independent protein translocase protein TatA
MHLGTGELLVVLLVVLLVFGPNKLPQLGDSLGKSIRNFKKASMTDEAAPIAQVEAAPSLPSASMARTVSPAPTVAVTDVQVVKDRS